MVEHYFITYMKKKEINLIYYLCFFRLTIVDLYFLHIYNLNSSLENVISLYLEIDTKYKPDTYFKIYSIEMYNNNVKYILYNLINLSF